MLFIHHIIENNVLIWKYLIFQSSENLLRAASKIWKQAGTGGNLLGSSLGNRSIRGHGVWFAHQHLES